MEDLVLGLLAVEQQEGVDEQRQVRHDADVERAVGLQCRGINREVVGEVKRRRGGAGAAGGFRRDAHGGILSPGTGPTD
jgi:hypothetical protein